MDAATHYPIAIPMKEHKAIDVCKALTEVFAQFGFPNIIQSDLGTDFMAEITQAFFQQFQIVHKTSTAYHPQSQGQIERFHRCMKTMLESLQDELEENWDQALPWILFSYRECPTETLGFSPFELIFTYQVKGPLSLLKDQWIKSTSNRPHVIKFLMDLRNKMEVARKTAEIQGNKNKEAMKTNYD